MRGLNEASAGSLLKFQITLDAPRLWSLSSGNLLVNLHVYLWN